MRKQAFGQDHKSLLDRIIAWVRLRQVRSAILPGTTILDLGCGYQGELLTDLRGVIAKGAGIDLQVAGKPELRKGRVDQKLPYPDHSFETVSALAIIEHVDHPEIMLNESYRVLKPGGRLLITTPSLAGKLPLELMAGIRLISKTEIDDHKRYYTKRTLEQALVRAGFTDVRVRHFGILWLNLFARATK